MPILVEELSSTNDSTSLNSTNNVKIEAVNDTPYKSNNLEEKSQSKPIYTGPRYFLIFL